MNVYARATLAALPALGLVLLIVGFVGDLNRWWDELGYTSNVLAGLTGACFGIPLAYFVLQRLFRDEDRSRRRSEVDRMTREQLDRFRIAVSKVLEVSNEQLVALSSMLGNAHSELSKLCAGLQHAQPVSSLPLDAVDKVQTAITDARELSRTMQLPESNDL